MTKSIFCIGGIFIEFICAYKNYRVNMVWHNDKFTQCQIHVMSQIFRSNPFLTRNFTDDRRFQDRRFILCGDFTKIMDATMGTERDKIPCT